MGWKPGKSCQKQKFKIAARTDWSNKQYTNIHKYTNLTEGQKVLLCQFKINISTCCSFSINKLNHSKANKNEKSRDTVQQI